MTQIMGVLPEHCRRQTSSADVLGRAAHADVIRESGQSTLW
jgi:hypothetical protein